MALRLTPAKKSVVAPEPITEPLDPPSPPIGPITRGRNRRRERRKNGGKAKSQKEAVHKIPDEILGKARDLTSHKTSTSGKGWRFVSGEIGPESQTNKSLVGLFIQLDNYDAKRSQETHSEDNYLGSGKDFPLSKEIPLVFVRPLTDYHPPASKTRRFHVMSYCNTAPHSSNKDSVCSSPLTTKEKGTSSINCNVLFADFCHRTTGTGYFV